jgi:NAD(P)-dependent dehydrogenase (short-subunit alcohol dehydrogenase family)
MFSPILANKKIVIVGGTSGMGLSAAKAFILEGADVVAVGNDETRSQTAAQELGEKAFVLTADATHEATAEEAIHACYTHFGGFDALYHIAGGSGRKMGDGPLDEMSLEGWNFTLQLNLTSMMLSNRAAVKHFLKYGTAGAILNMGSVLGFSPSPGFFTTHAYAASKSAAIGFSKSIAAYYVKKNIRINVIAPGLVDSPMSTRAMENDTIQQFIKTKQPLDGGRSGIPSDLDGLAGFLLSDSARFITGQVISVDGGWSVTEGQYAK